MAEYNAQQLLEQLREAILHDDRAVLDEVCRVINSEEQLDMRVGNATQRRIENRMASLKQNLKKELGPEINELVEEKIEASKEEIIQLLYPVMGQLITKFISYQFQQLQERIEEKINNTKRSLSPKQIWNNLRAKFGGVSQAQLAIMSVSEAQVDEVYLIQKGSGLLLGSYSRGASTDQDIIAGMLTAIKGFVEDAFGKANQEVEMIEWQNYKIVIQGTPQYYLAVALSGTVSVSFKEKLAEKLLVFAEKELKGESFKQVDSHLHTRISEKLSTHFQDYETLKA